MIASRRQVLQSLLAAGVTPGARRVKLGLDNYSVRAMKWKAAELVDYAAKLRTDSLFITDLDAFDSLDDRPLTEVRKRAADKGVQLHLGTWSVCPTSSTFKKTWGTAEEHLTLAIRVAKALGSPVARVVLGNAQDRSSPGGIRARMADTLKVLKACRGRAVDAGVKIALENHAGDMQTRELAALIEEAGKDYVGANIDSGNALWTMEDPQTALEVLAPYVVTSSLRDGVVWETERGAVVQWTAMGEGMVDFRGFFARFVELCPGVPVHIETISGGRREFPYLEPAFWSTYPDHRGADFARFVALAKRGKPREPVKPVNDQEFQRGEIERSLRYCKETLGLGLRA